MPKYIDFDALGVQSCNPDVFVNKGYAEGWNSLMRMLYDAPDADVEPKRKWIPVTERLPVEHISPLTMDYTKYPCVFDCHDGGREVRYFKFGNGHFWNGPHPVDKYITHWAEPMPLPDPPKGEDDA